MTFCIITFLLIAIVSRMLEVKVTTNTFVYGLVNKISVGIVALCVIALFQQ